MTLIPCLTGASLLTGPWLDSIYDINFTFMLDRLCRQYLYPREIFQVENDANFRLYVTVHADSQLQLACYIATSIIFHELVVSFGLDLSLEFDLGFQFHH